MNGLDLFSGIGGISIALSRWVNTVAYCEQDRYAQAVLLSRMQSGELDRAPIWDDVRTLRAEMLPRIDIIFGGFPCQDISVAGKGAGLSGDRSGLFYEIIRLVDECQPAFVFLENVPAIRTRGLQAVAESFAVRGYDFGWTVLSAAEVGAPHLRKRWFALAVMADTHGYGPSAQCFRDPRSMAETGSGKKSQRDQFAIRSAPCSAEVADTNQQRAQVPAAGQQSAEQVPERTRWWEAEPDVGRVADGVPARVDRIRCLGNAVVPLQAEKAFEYLMARLSERV